MEPTRINKLIAASGLCSRRTADEWIADGRVTVDGAVAVPGQRVDGDTAQVEVDGIPIPVRPGLVYYLLNKPVGVVSTAADPHGRPTVVELVPSEPRVHPVGRLDRDSGGLIILTNDGDLTMRLTHPSFGVLKVYTVLVSGRLDPSTESRLVGGIDLDDGPARAVAVSRIAEHEDRTVVEVTMAEGRNREIRRMFDAVGHPVAELFRTAIGPIRDPELRSGAHRRLEPTEVRALYAAARGAP